VREAVAENAAAQRALKRGADKSRDVAAGTALGRFSPWCGEVFADDAVQPHLL
jgi:hypothetical protein